MKYEPIINFILFIYLCYTLLLYVDVSSGGEILGFTKSLFKITCDKSQKEGGLVDLIGSIKELQWEG